MKDKGAAMTLIFLNAGAQKRCHYLQEDVLIISDGCNRILHHQKSVNTKNNKKNHFPLVNFPYNSYNK